jgi:hypothetical protein
MKSSLYGVRFERILCAGFSTHFARHPLRYGDVSGRPAFPIQPLALFEYYL